jgi:hypothetical protein
MVVLEGQIEGPISPPQRDDLCGTVLLEYRTFHIGWHTAAKNMKQLRSV